MTDFIFQAVTDENHAQAVNSLLGLSSPEKVIISTAFMNEGGLSLLEDALSPIADKTTLIAGIRNGITTAQGCNKAIDIGCSLYAVDTGSRNVIFHPKFYFARNAKEAHVILGSANLTIGGLNSNIEASVSIKLDLGVDNEAASAKQLENKIATMISEYPEHVFQVENKDLVQALLDSGRLIDENAVRAPTGSGKSVNRDLDKISKMQLKTTPVKWSKRSVVKTTTKATSAKASQTKPATPVTPTPQAGGKGVLVWESNALTRRDLNIPTGEKTNQTGSMLFKKGAWQEDIDHRHYFRDEVFNGLDWKTEPSSKNPNRERVKAEFRFIIKGVDYGIYTLLLAHDPRTNTKTYNQKNSMTQIHWGEAKPIIALEDLLERTMYVFGPNENENAFVIEID